MKRSWLLGLAIWSATVGWAEECPIEGTVTVYMHNVVIAPAVVLLRAERMAAGMFADVGVSVRFRTGVPRRPPHANGCRSAANPVIEVRLHAHAPPNRGPRVLAYAIPWERAGTRIHIFYDRIDSIREGSLTTPLLGHVLAHEIAHVLQRVSRHSSQGVLKARWDERDYSAMAVGPLRFTPEDAGLLHESLRSLAE